MAGTSQDGDLKTRIRNQIIKAAVNSSDVVTKSATKEEMREADTDDS